MLTTEPTEQLLEQAQEFQGFWVLVRRENGIALSALCDDLNYVSCYPTEEMAQGMCIFMDFSAEFFPESVIVERIRATPSNRPSGYAIHDDTCLVIARIEVILE